VVLLLLLLRWLLRRVLRLRGRRRRRRQRLRPAAAATAAVAPAAPLAVVGGRAFGFFLRFVYGRAASLGWGPLPGAVCVYLFDGVEGWEEEAMVSCWSRLLLA